MRRIVLHISRLKVNGMDPADARAFAAELQRELARQLSEPGAGDALAGQPNRNRIQAGTVHTGGEAGKPGGAAAVAGRIIGRALT